MEGQPKAKIIPEGLLFREPVKERLIILDLNGILVHRVFEKDRSKDQMNGVNGKDCVREGNFIIRKRPGCDEFLDSIFARAEVGIWSSAMKHNVIPMAKYIMGDHYKDLLFIWDKDDCEKIKAVVEGEQPTFAKNLRTVWDKYPCFNEDNTIIIDDSEAKMINNPKACHRNPGKWEHGVIDAESKAVELSSLQVFQSSTDESTE